MIHIYFHLSSIGKVLHYDIGKTLTSRMASLLAMATNKIPEQLHQNYGTVSEEEKLDSKCFLVLFHSFVKRYCPSIFSYLATSCMGVEWEYGALPDEVFE